MNQTEIFTKIIAIEGTISIMCKHQVCKKGFEAMTIDYLEYAEKKIHELLNLLGDWEGLLFNGAPVSHTRKFYKDASHEIDKEFKERGLREFTVEELESKAFWEQFDW